MGKQNFFFLNDPGLTYPTDLLLFKINTCI